tara:strand:- start:136 stop:378 length:243 start_codon:yes stop_codon:yes gene_type:complete
MKNITEQLLHIHRDRHPLNYYFVINSDCSRFLYKSDILHGNVSFHVCDQVWGPIHFQISRAVVWRVWSQIENQIDEDIKS